jgi:uncharacterized protein (DUF885 family)
MPLDFSKLNMAVSKVADLAKEHAAAHAARDAAVADLANAQSYIDSLAHQLISAAQTPAEAVGLTAVAAALTSSTFLPGDPRAPKA